MMKGGKEGWIGGMTFRAQNLPDIPQPQNAIIAPRRDQPSILPSLPGNARNTRPVRGAIMPHRPFNPSPQVPPLQTGVIPPTPDHLPSLPPSLPPFPVLVYKDSDPDFDRLRREGVGVPCGEEGEFAGLGVEGMDGEAAFALARDDALPLLLLPSLVVIVRLCCWWR